MDYLIPIFTVVVTLFQATHQALTRRVGHIMESLFLQAQSRMPSTVKSTVYSRQLRRLAKVTSMVHTLAEDWYASVSQSVQLYPERYLYSTITLIFLLGMVVAFSNGRRRRRKKRPGPFVIDDQTLKGGGRLRAINNGIYGLLGSTIIFQILAALAIQVNTLYYFAILFQVAYVVKEFATHKVRDHVHYRTPEVDPHNARAFRFSVISHKWVAKHKPNPSNEHAEAAAERNNAATWLNSYGREHGRPLWSLSKSGRDLRENIPGDRGIRTAKDMVSYETTSRDPIPFQGLVKCMDDLHYLTPGEMNDLLCDTALTQSVIGAYDWTPKAPAFDHHETVGHYNGKEWEFCSGNEDVYKHSLWDYTVPTMSALKFSFSWRIWLASLAVLAIIFELVHQYFRPEPLFSAFGYDICNAWYRYDLPYLYGLTEWFNYLHGWATGQLVAYDASVDVEWLAHLSTFYSQGWRVLGASVPPAIHIPYLYDCTTARAYWGLLAFGSLGLTAALARITTFHFVVVRKRVSEHRAIIMLKPTVHYGTIMSILTAWTTLSTLPKRFKPTARTISNANEDVRDTVVYGLEHTEGEKSGYWLSAALSRESFFVTRSEVVDLIGLDHVTGKGHISPGYYCVKAKSKLTPGRAAIAIAYFGQGLSITRSVNYDTPAEDVPYRLRPHMHDELDVKPSMEMFMGGVIDKGTYHAIHDRTNTQVAVKKRVTDYAQTAPLPRQGQSKRDQYAEEFYSHLAAPSGGMEVLDNLSAILDKQKRPGQKINIDEAKRYMSMLPEDEQERVMDAFLKSEALKKPSDPRLITVANPLVKLVNSLIAYRVTAAMKKQLWYAFGVSPLGVAKRVVEIMYGATTATPSDYTRYDATIKEEMRRADRVFLRKLFRPSQHEVVMKNYSRVYANEVRASTNQGSVWYEQGPSQASGDPFTSCLHTARNGLIVYSGLRMLGMSKEQALKFLDDHGIYGGDDGLTSDLPKGVLEKGSELWGVIVKVDIKNRGEHVDFLSRIYGPGVWAGDSDNCAAIVRALVKFPVTTKIHGICKELLAHFKATSAICNDPYTPVLGVWAKTVGAATADIKQGVSKGALCATETAMRLWNLRWCEGNPELGYQAEMKGTPQWMEEYVAQELGPCASGLITTWARDVADGRARWDAPPVLQRYDLKRRDLPYMWRGMLVPALDDKPTVKDDPKDAVVTNTRLTPTIPAGGGAVSSSAPVGKQPPGPTGKIPLAPVRGPIKPPVPSKPAKTKDSTPITSCQWREGDSLCGKTFTQQRIDKGCRLCYKHSGAAYKLRQAKRAALIPGKARKIP